MKLDKNEERRCTAMNIFFKKMDHKQLAKNRIFTCNACKGTGLSGLYFGKRGNSIGWDCKSFCPECGGVGYRGNVHKRQISNEIILCKYCYGSGCSNCNHTGIVDWVTYLMGG